MLYPKVQTPYIDAMCVKHTVATGVTSANSVDLGTGFAGEDIILAITGHNLSTGALTALEGNVIQGATAKDQYVNLDTDCDGQHLDVYWHDVNP